MVKKNYLNSMAQRKNVKIESDFLIGSNGPREIWSGQWTGSEKKWLNIDMLLILFDWP